MEKKGERGHDKTNTNLILLPLKLTLNCNLSSTTQELTKAEHNIFL